MDTEEPSEALSREVVLTSTFLVKIEKIRKPRLV